MLRARHRALVLLVALSSAACGGRTAPPAQYRIGVARVQGAVDVDDDAYVTAKQVASMPALRRALYRAGLVDDRGRLRDVRGTSDCSYTKDTCYEHVARLHVLSVTPAYEDGESLDASASVTSDVTFRAEPVGRAGTILARSGALYCRDARGEKHVWTGGDRVFAGTFLDPQARGPHPSASGTDAARGMVFADCPSPTGDPPFAKVP